MIPVLFNLIKNSPKILWCFLWHNDRNHWDICQKCNVELKEIVMVLVLLVVALIALTFIC